MLGLLNRITDKMDIRTALDLVGIKLTSFTFDDEAREIHLEGFMGVSPFSQSFSYDYVSQSLTTAVQADHPPKDPGHPPR